MARRGRPRTDSSAKLAKADAVIAATAEQLIQWGAPRRRVYEILCKLAKDVLGRTDHARLALGPDRIEQIHELHRSRNAAKFPRYRYTKQSLQQELPVEEYEDKHGRWIRPIALPTLARRLLENDGHWPEGPRERDPSTRLELPSMRCDPELTPKGIREEETRRRRTPKIVRGRRPTVRHTVKTG